MIVELIGARTAKTALIIVPPLPQCEVSVIVPVKDEAQTIAKTLTALANQTDLNGKPLNPLTYEVIILANNCSDESAMIARQFAQQHPNLVLHIAEMTLPPDRAYIGHVRKMLMDEAYLRLMSLGRSRGIVASTDGDTQVSATWIAAILDEIGSGVDAVGGRILTDRSSRQALHPQAKSHFLQEVGYRSLVTQVEFHLDPDPYDPLPRHYQHYGASLAVTAEMYAKAGGIPPVRTPEDEAFYQALLRVDARFRHSPLVQVTTSARVSGRSPVGLAAQLHKWTQMSEDSTFKVESSATMIDWFKSRRQLRSLWQGLSAESQLSLDSHSVSAKRRRCQRVGEAFALAKTSACAERLLLGQTLRYSQRVEPLAARLGISANWLFAELLQHHTFGNLFERVTQRQHQRDPNHWQPIDIMTAIRELRQYLATLNHRAIQDIRRRYP